MANGTLPAYLASAKPNPMSARAPWYATIAPSYAGIFLWIAFYNDLGNALPLGGLGAALLGLVVAGLVSYLLFYYVFGTLGMRTGLPLYVVGSSTFGTKGGYLFPGIFMGLLQIGWYSVATYFAAKLLLLALPASWEMAPKTIFDASEDGKGFSLLFVIVAIAWGYIFAFFGALGIKYVARVSSIFPWVALAMLVIAAACAAGGVGKFEPPEGQSIGAIAAICLVVQMVVGFFATAGAAGVDFGTAARNEKDVNLGGLVGVALATIVAGGLAVIAVAGAHGMNPALEAFTFDGKGVLSTVSPKLAGLMFLLFAIGSMAPACFCSSIIGNSLSTMIPSLPRIPLTLGGATIGIVLAATGLAGNLLPFFGLIGASFGPICGAMVADYLLSGKKWAGPREGVSVAGYAAWIIGFLVGISNNAVVTGALGKELVAEWQPTAVYSFIVGFVVFAVLAKAGLQGKVVPYAHAAPAAGAAPATGPASA
jgi:cytosine permease